MFYMTVLMLQIVFCFFLFRYFRARMKNVLGGEELKQELAALIVNFNQQADKHLTLFEDRIRLAKTAADELDLRVERQKRSVFFAPQERTAAPETISLKPSPNRKIEKKPAASEIELQSDQDGLMDLLREKEDVELDQLPLAEKIRILRKRKWSERRIARELDLSIQEMQMLTAALNSGSPARSS